MDPIRPPNMTCRTTITALFAAALCAGCSSISYDAEWARRANLVEARIDAGGNLAEVEYHIPPNTVPDPVRSAMLELYPGATLTSAEYEVARGGDFYELTATVGGRSVEAMFTAEGELHSLELEVARDSAPAVTQRITSTWPGSTVRMLEEIRDASRNFVEYHVKIDHKGAKYKIVADAEGTIRAALRETPAELEVPVSIPGQEEEQ